MEILRSVSKLYGWNRFEPSVKKVISLQEEEKVFYTGTFQADETLKIRIDLKEGGLVGVPLWGQPPFQLLPEAPDQFFDREDGTVLKFTRDEEGAVTGFEVQGYNFQRVEK